MDLKRLISIRGDDYLAKKATADSRTNYTGTDNTDRARRRRHSPMILVHGVHTMYVKSPRPLIHGSS